MEKVFAIFPHNGKNVSTLWKTFGPLYAPAPRLSTPIPPRPAALDALPDLGEKRAVNVDGKHYRTIWLESPDCVRIIDQALLPHEFAFMDLRTPEEMGSAIRKMHLRGAGLIGCAAAWGMYLAALRHAASINFTTWMLAEAAALTTTRPTANNLEWALARMLRTLAACQKPEERIECARQEAQAITDEDAEFSRRMGQHGLALVREIAKRKEGQPVNILTHCNAGWLAFVDHGTALAPVYAAHDAGIPVHVWVDETRPRNQGAALTTWELGHHGVPHTLIPDNAGGHLMQHGLVDIVFVGSDRTTAAGDVANKIGTYLKALAAHDNGVPFYAVLPCSTIDWNITDGVREIPIEERGAEEVRFITGWDEAANKPATIRICPEKTPAANYGFDVTPARLVTGIITERGIAPASREGLRKLYADLHP
jgi:methylthioribose-1-phosphate isomerase